MRRARRLAELESAIDSARARSSDIGPLGVGYDELRVPPFAALVRRCASQRYAMVSLSD